MNNAFELITRYVLDASSYTAGGNAIIATTERVGQAITHVSGGILSGLQSAVRSVFSPIVALAGGAGLLALAHGAVEAALSFDTTRRSLEAVTGSAERAKSVMDFADKLAGPTKFLAEDLANAALRLEAFRLNTEKFLPVATSLAAVFGGSKESLLEYADALGEIQSGRAGRGMMILERAGVTKPDLEKKGVTFSKGGELTSSITAALDAIQQVVQERYGKLAESMASSPAAKIASAMDSLTKAARVAGFAILSILVPAMEKVAKFIDWLVNSGTLERAVSGITRLFNGDGIGDFLVKAIAYLVATIQELPYVFLIVRSAAENFFSFIKENFHTIGVMLIAAFTFGTILEGLGAIIVAVNALRKANSLAAVAALVLETAMSGGAKVAVILAAAAAAYAAGIVGMNALEGMAGQAMDTSPIQQLSGIGERIDKRAKGYITDSDKPAPTVKDVLSTVVNALTSPIGQIVNHTQRTARNTDKLQEVTDKILGGGAVGKGAADAVNIDKALKGSGGGGDEADQIASLIRRMVDRVSGGQIVSAQYQARGGR